MNKAQLINHIKSIYDERSMIALNKLEKLKNNYLDEHPDLEAALEKRADLRWSNLQDILAGKDKDELQDESKLEFPAELEAEYKEYNNLDKQAFFCEICLDQGHINNKYCPNCYNDVFIKVLKEDIPAYLPNKDFTFENFDLDVFSDEDIELGQATTSARTQMEYNLERAKEFIENFPAAANMFFQGPIGTGKTFLASCIANDLLSKNYLALVLSTNFIEEIINNLRVKEQSFSTKEAELDKAKKDYQLLLEADLLVIDDFGIMAGLLNNPLAEIMNLLSLRKLKDKSTIITTNLNMRQLKSVYDERLFSRLVDNFDILSFIGADLRLKGKLEA